MKSTMVTNDHCSSDALFTADIQPFVVAVSDKTCMKIKTSNFFSGTEAQLYEEVITSFTSEGDYILTNNTNPCRCTVPIKCFPTV